jgi:hypothetical protein
MRYWFSAAVVALSVSAVNAQILTPGVNEAWNGGLSSPSREAPRVMQSFIDSSFLTDVIVPVPVTGLSFRLPASANTTYPSQDLNFGRYEITLALPSAAAAAANGLTSDTFADNMTAPILVRSGALTIPTDSFTDNDTGPGVSSQAGPAEFSFFIDFDTPYLLAPGQDLVVLIRHNGHGLPLGTVPAWNFDDFAWTNGGRVSTGNVDATSGSLLPNTVLKYALVIPEPSSLALLGVGGLLALRRRRA